jgi:hypothetical protein
MAQGTTPYISRGGQIDISRIFYGKIENAQSKSITIPGGYGVLRSGQVMAKITESTSRLGMYTPYVNGDGAVLGSGIPIGSTTLPGAAYLTTDGAVSKSIYVTMIDSYKFAVGDHLALGDYDTYGSGNNVDLGAITAIDRDTYSHVALITVTNNASASFTVAAGAAVWIQTATSSPFCAAVGLLMGSVDTGTGEDAKGANGVLIIGGAMAYKDRLNNYDGDALADMSWASENGEFLVL